VAAAVTVGTVIGIAPAAAAVGRAMVIETDATGTAPFTAAGVPGGDAGPSDDVIRTNDGATFRVTVRAGDHAAADARITLTAPAKTRFATLPSDCGPGSAITDDELECRLGTMAAGTVRAVPVVLTVLGDAQNGQKIAFRGEFSSADSADHETATSPTLRVSAAPRYDLTKNAVAPIVRSGVTGPDGREGLTVTYPIGITWRPAVPDDNRLLGFEQLTGPIRFTDDPSGLTGGASSDAVLLDGAAGCGLNTPSQFPGLPGGKGGGASAVRDSGTISCTQASPGAPIGVTLSGTDTDLTPTTLPTENQNGGEIPGGVAAHVVEAWISVWAPYRTDVESYEAKNTLTALRATSISGAANVDDPAANNTAVFPVLIDSPGVAYKAYRRMDASGQSHDNSARTGNPWLTAGATMRSDVGLDNAGVRPYDSALLCDVFDNRYQRIHDGGPHGESAYAYGFAATASVQYAARTWTTPAEAQAQRCADSDAHWYDSPDQVPGGPAAVGMVRAVGPVAGFGAARLRTYLEVLPADNGTKVRNFAAYSIDGGTTWRGDTADPEFGLGGLADHLVITKALARIDKRVVDEGYDASTTPDRTAYAQAGDEITYALYPSLTSFARSTEHGEVTISDTLPVGAEYVPGSASVEPESVETVPGPDGDRQRLGWRLPDVTTGQKLDPITYDAVIGAGAVDSAVNSAVVSSPLDVSAEAVRTATRGLHIVRSGGVAVEKTAVDPTVLTGDDARWTLAATNIEATPIDGVDVIDALPENGDALGTAVHGPAHLAGAVAVDGAAGERVRYTDRPAAEISEDPRDPSNSDGGATTWCSETDFGRTGCPSGFSDVTGVRIDRGGALAPGQRVEWTIAMAAPDTRNGDRLVNRFGLVASNLALSTRSNPASVGVVSGAVGDLVWLDRNADGIRQGDEPGMASVPVRLHGSADDGSEVTRRTTTDADGGYRFDGLRPGTYSVCVDVPAGYDPTSLHAGSDAAIDSDIGADGCTASFTLERITEDGRLVSVTRDMDVDAGLVTNGDPTPTPGDGSGGGPGNGSGGGSSDGGGSAGASRPALAFTGGAIGAGVVVAALLAVLAGALLRRRRNGAPSVDD
jgi:hypothetical protein